MDGLGQDLFIGKRLQKGPVPPNKQLPFQSKKSILSAAMFERLSLLNKGQKQGTEFGAFHSRNLNVNPLQPYYHHRCRKA